MKRAVSITLTRAEGYHHECGKPVTFTTDPWAEAKAELVRMSHTAPGAPGELDMGGNKTDFKVTWDDGFEYDGTFFLRYDDTDLPAHIRGFMEHLIEHRDTYERMDVNIDEVQEFLANYEIGAQPVNTIANEDRHDADGKAYIAYFLTEPMMHFIWSGNHDDPVQVTRGESGEAITETFLVPPVALGLEWNEAFAALEAIALQGEADGTIRAAAAARYQAASDAVNHANRKWESSTANVLQEFRLACDQYARTTCDGCDQDPWRESVHYGTCPLAPELECLDRHDGECEGTVEYRHSLSGSGKSFPRCERHWVIRLDVQDGIRKRYPEHAPADFDPSYAGESWDGQ